MRKITGRKPRIWHGFLPVHLLRPMADVDRHLGYPTRSVVVSSKVLGYALMTDDQFDLVLDSSGVAWRERHWAVLADILRHADIWVANFDCLFFPWHDRRNDWAMRVLRSMGVRIVVMPHGTDILQWNDHLDRYGWVERLSRDYPTWNMDEQTIVSRRRVAIFTRHAHFVISGDSSLDPFLPRRDLRFKYFPVSIPPAATQPVVDASPHPPRVTHAPNHRFVKGTPELLEAVALLQAKGIACELRLVEKVAPTEAQAIYASADVIADQFIIGAYGAFALEGLALGKPVLTYLDEEHLRDPAFNLPIVNTTLENMTAVLAAVLTIPELRRRLGAAGRAAVQRYHSHDALGEVWDRLYRHVWYGQPLALETTRHFEPSRGRRAMTEDPSDEEFWPVNVSDLIGDIRTAVARVV